MKNRNTVLIKWHFCTLLCVFPRKAVNTLKNKYIQWYWILTLSIWSLLWAKLKQKPMGMCYVNLMLGFISDNISVKMYNFKRFSLTKINTLMFHFYPCLFGSNPSWILSLLGSKFHKTVDVSLISKD